MFRILFVGEQVNLNKSKIPFDERYNSGKFLCDALAYGFSGYISRGMFKFYFNNSIVNGKINKKLINKSRGKKVIALGNIADKVLTGLRIKHKKLPHPAFFKRFRSKEGYKGYGYLLFEEIYGN
jgi:hypothetical protein